MKQNYSETINDHYHHPRNTGKISDYTHTAEQINALCGDEIRIYLKIVNSKIENLLDYPTYTRPESFKGWKVPSVLLSGNHAEIVKWRMQKASQKTHKIRPDLGKKR